jgi:HEAT repeat protein
MADPTRGSVRPGADWLVEEDAGTRKEAEARAKLASEAALAIERTLKSFRQFGVRHKTSQGFVADTVKRVGAFNGIAGELPLSVVGSDILYDGESIYSDPELRQSYPFLLFRDGVQRLIFEPGLEPDEVRGFCQVLRDQSLQGSRVSMEDDLVTLLWDADLAHVRYVVTESFRQEEGTDEAERAEQRRRLIAQIKTDAFAPAMSSELSARFVRPPKEREVERAKEDLAVAQAWEHGKQLLADEKARAALASEVDTDDVLLRKFLEIVFAEILGKKDPKTRNELVALVREFTVEAARRDRLVEAIGVLRALGELARLAGAEGRQVAQEILSAIATDEMLTELMHQLQIADEHGTEDLLTFLALMPPREARRLVPLLRQVELPQRRRAVCNLLADRLGDELAAVGEQLRGADEGLALDLVYLLRTSRSPRARVELLLALDNASNAVRLQGFDAIRAGGEPLDPILVGASLHAVEDSDPELRRLALLSLPRRLDSEVARRMREVIGRDGFDGWDYFDKRRAFLAFAAATGKRSARDLLEVLSTHALFSNDALEDRRCAAAFALASLGDESHLAVLEGEAKRMFAGKRVKEACEGAAAILKFKRPVEVEAEHSSTPIHKDDLETIATSHLPRPIWDDPGAT